MLASLRHPTLVFALIAFLALSSIASGSSLGTCSSAHPSAPTTRLHTSSTAATLTGTRLRVNPRIPDTGESIDKYYIDAEVFMLREMEPSATCIKSTDTLSLEAPFILQVNTSECNCTHTPGFDFFPDSNVRRDYVRVAFSCANFSQSFLTLDVNIVNGSYAVAHTAAMGPNATTYDYYTPNSVKFNVSAVGWPWSSEPESYLAFWIRSTVNAVGFTMATNSSTDSLRIELRNKDYMLIEEVQRSFVLDGLSYLTQLPTTTTSGFELIGDLVLESGISLCFNQTYIPLRATNFSYDPTLSAIFLGTVEPPGKPRSKIVQYVVPPVVIGVLLIVVIFVLVARNTPAIKNYFRPFRNPNKDDAKYSRKK